MERIQGVKMGKGLRENVLLGSNVLVVNGRMMKMRMMRMEVYRGPEKDGSVKRRMEVFTEEWKDIQEENKRVFRRRMEVC